MSSWVCAACTFNENNSARTICEMCGTGKDGSAPQAASTQAAPAAATQTAPSSTTSSTAQPSTAQPEAPKEEGKRKYKDWIPLESNPELLDKYLWQLGGSKEVQFHEIIGTDPDLLAMVPTPVHAVIMCFPISEASEKHRREEAEKMAGKPFPPKLYHTLQTVGNACGTVAMIHAVLNNADVCKLDENKFFGKFLKETKSMTPAERAEALERNTDIEVEHHSVATASEAKSAVESKANDNMHFNCFVQQDGRLYELDGRKKFPIDHGPTTNESFLADTMKVISQFMARDPTEIRFNMVALGPAQ